MVRPFLLFLLSIILFSYDAVASKEDPVKSEKEHLITPFFKNDLKTSSGLSNIFLKIIQGKYRDAENQIQKLSKGVKTDKILKASLLCYEANITYNQSAYERSAELCDSAIQLFNPGSAHRIVHRALNYKAKALGALNHYNESTEILTRVISSAKRSGDPYNLAAAYYYLGSIYADLGDYRKSLTYFQKSASIRHKIGDKLGLAASYAFIGSCYSGLDRYQEAIDLIHKSIVIRERLGDKRGLANSYLSMYKVYFELGELRKAMSSEYKSLMICKDISDLQCVSGRYTNLGELHQKLGQFEKAYYFHKKALQLSKRLKIKNRIALVHENLAKVFLHSEKFELARAHLDTSTILRLEIGDEEGIVSVNLTKSQLAIAKNDLKTAQDASEKALILACKLGIRSYERDAHHLLSEIENLQNNYKKALEHYDRYVHLKDSLFSIDQSKQLLRQELEMAFSKKEQRQKEDKLRLKENAIKESSYQRKIIWASLMSLVFVSALLLFSLAQYRSKTRSQRRLEEANNELLSVNELLERKKEIIEFQHHEITDSLEYARQIQQAVLPNPDDVRTLLPNSFVFYQPKDVISGDFYWITQLGEKLIIAVADGTGHGVPGGFLTMLGVAILNELVLEQKNDSPAEIMNSLRSKVISSLKQTQTEGEHKDGLDMTLCVFNKKSRKLTYASANQTFFVQQKNELLAFKGNHFPVGLHAEELLPFQEFELQLNSGDFIYLLTDGFSDQFGGPRNKKYKIKNTNTFLNGIQELHFDEKLNAVVNEFKTWKGNQTQTDDVTVFGFEIL